MEKAFLTRLTIRQEMLVKTIKEAKDTIHLIGTVGVDLKAVYKLQYLLKNNCEKVQTEMSNYMAQSNKEISEDLIRAVTASEVEAEELVAELVSLEKSGVQTNKEPSATTNAKLPKLLLPSFDGDIQQWHQFWDRFEITIHKSNLSDADKLTYLLGCLQGSALNKVTGISTTNINYSVAIEILKKRYGSKAKLIDCHYAAIYKMKRCSSSPTDCQRTLDDIEKNMRILQELGEDINGNQFRSAILEKFPESVMTHVYMKTGCEESTQGLLKALEEVVSALEKTENRSLVDTDFTQQGSSSAAALHVSTERKEKRKHPDTKDRPQKRKMDHKKQSVQTHKKTRAACIFCEGSHYNDMCKEVSSLEERKMKLNGRCFYCFRKGHNAKACRIKRKCTHCKKLHNRALCPQKLTTVAGNNSATMKTLESSCLTSNYSNVISYLQTATVKILANNLEHQCRLLLDCGSQRSYITAKTVNRLNLTPEKEPDLLLIYTFGSNDPKETSSPSVKVKLVTKRNIKKTIQANVVPHITDRLPVPNITMPSHIDVAADDNSMGEGIDILIGNDYYFSFIQTGRICLQENLYLIDSDFGWLVSGKALDKAEDTILSVITYCQCHNAECPYFTEPDLPLRNVDMKFLWSLESIGITDSPKTTQQEEAVKHFNATVEFRDSRYFVQWPWIQTPPDIPTNFGLAYGRLKSLLRRLDENTLKEYEDILKEQLNAGVIEIVNTESSQKIGQQNPPVHYLPHHIVKQRELNPTKRGRIVYDASAKIRDSKSLNEALYKGPSMLEDLTALLLKFRTGRIGITGDVEKAFLQVGLQEGDRDVTRFLWIKDINKEPTEENLLHLRFCRVPFGIISSPFILTATIRYHLSRNNSELLKKVADRCYVDNLVTNSDSVAEAVELYTETRKIFSEISMNIRDWVSNNEEFINAIPEEYRGKQKETVKLLGLTWNLREDTLELKVHDDIANKESKANVTKREVLKTLARVYDPCGFAAPLILPAKLLFQELCTRKVKWDSTIPDDMLERWSNVCDSLHLARDIKLPRYTGDKEVSKEENKYDLHCFTDASQNSYAAVVFLVTYSPEKTNTAFIMSKARITPAEEKGDLKIPKLELLGYLIGSRLLKYVRNNLELVIENQYLWTDSMIVLSWMRSNKLLPPFVLRRVNEIKQNSDVDHCYINTNLNPADLATRPELWHEKKHLWFNGPDFLKENKSCWPKNMHMQAGEQASFLLAGEALDEALDEAPSTIRRLQANFFPEEVAGKETHLSRNLGLFKDGDGVLRCRGRMMNASWPYEQKYPALIPKDSTFTNELISNTHITNYHVGTPHTLSLIRQRYWIPQGRAQVQKVLKKCPQCVKHGGGPYKLPPPPPLPSERVRYSTPFTYTGVDYFGPLFVDKTPRKRWVCLFTCLAVRAIHLEVVEDLSAEECLLAIRRFVAARGLPQMIVSDNAQNFKLTSEVLTSPYCIQNKIYWKFIPQLAPWHGGFYERLVALVKHCLKRTMEKHLLHDSQLKTIIKEVETVVNTRPLTHVGSDLETVLRPADFLTLGKCLTTEPSEKEILTGTKVKIDLVNSWKRGQRILEEFKKMFIHQYLFSLRERYRHSSKQPRVTSEKTPKIGDLVQIKDDSKNRINWKVGNIISLLKGKDDQCRVAKVRVGDTEFIRSLAHLYPLEDDATPTEETPIVAEPPQHIVDRDTNDLPSTEQDNLETDLIQDTETNEAHLPEQDFMEVDPDQSPSLDEVPPETLPQEPEDSGEDTSANEVSDITMEPSSHLRLTDNNTDDGDSEKEMSPEIEPRRQRRGAAIRARERIAQWTRQLFTYLQLSA